MTAEAAILNKSAIAVAADSAITVGKSRVHTLSNKIFAISDSTPIGFMIYGYSEFCGVPWETLVKVFRKDCAKKKYRTVSECLDEFLKFVGDTKFLNEKHQTENLIRFTVDMLDRVLLVANKLGEGDWEKRLSSAIDVGLASTDPIDFKVPDLDEFTKNAAPIVDAVVEDANGPRADSDKIPKTLEPQIVKLVHHALGCRVASTRKAGVVMFGFGEDELFPHLASVETDSSCLGQVRVLARRQHVVNDENPVSVISFAERTVSQLFMENVSSDMRRYFDELAAKLALAVADQVIRQNLHLPDDEEKVARALIKRTVDKLLSEASKRTSKYIIEGSVRPILRVIEGLPKEELARLAEAIVEVTALKKKVSGSVESVGGPIDVCLITKGDGLIWIKRKQYFDLEINQQYLNHRFN